MEASDLEMKAYYASRASYYDVVYEKPERRLDIAFLKQHLPERLRGREVLEVACGTGYWSQHIAPACTRYVATDGVAEPLEIAKNRVGLSRTNCFVADAYVLPTSLGLFDGAFAGLWFSHVSRERYTEFFGSLHARLRPGARVLLIDNSTVQCAEFPIVETDDHGNTYQQRPLRDGTTHRVLKNFPSQAQLEALADRFGASRSEFRALDNFWYFEYDLPSL
jgi:demethylmenaquinone methyltransferase/2-methoxy-6-polyprenyl-1,4-benzoquinol methylase